MQVGAAFLCDHAETREGLLFVLGAGVGRIWRDQFPAPLGVSLGLLIELHRQERDRPHEFEVLILSQDGKEIARANGGFQVGAVPDLEVHEAAIVPLALDLRNVAIPAHGPYSVSISIDGEHRRTLNFAVRPLSQRPQIGPIPPKS